MHTSKYMNRNMTNSPKRRIVLKRNIKFKGFMSLTKQQRIFSCIIKIENCFGQVVENKGTQGL